MLTVDHATSQTPSVPPTNADDNSPWGGVPVTSIPPSGPPGSNPDSSTFCLSTDPCVLTGQYNRYRTSKNPNESSLAAFNNSNFGLAYLYQVSNPPALAPYSAYEGVIAQPLYATGVPYSGTKYDMLIVATLNDWIYAFDTSATSTSNVVAPLWSLNLIPAADTTHCGLNSQVFYDKYNGLPGATNLPYYGIVSTPVIDHTSATRPTLFVVSACTAQGTNVTTIKWFLDAVDLTTGAIAATPQAIAGSNFNPSNQLSRASLLLTHPSGAGTTPYIYVAFGTGVKEIGKEDGTNTWQYSGNLFGYSYSYSSGIFTALSGTPFPTECVTSSCATSSIFPAGVYTGFSGTDYPVGPAGPNGETGSCTIPATGASNCSPGSNWGVNGGGLWQSSFGPSSTSAANVYVASGNGAFACAGSGPSCTISSPVDYWGETSMQFPAGNATAPMAPQDFFTPNTLRYTCPYGTSCGANMPNNSTFTTDPLVTTASTTYQTQELSRLDLDMGVGGDVLLPHSAGGVSPQPFSMTSDKSSYLYVMPPAVGETGLTTGGLGQFQTNDAGLNGAGLTYTTQAPFQINREPTPTYPVCETISLYGAISGGSDNAGCDEVHELAWFSTYRPGNQSFHDLLFAWPANESIEDFKGTMVSPYTNYSFGTTPNFDPCPLPFTSANCTGSDPPFPRSAVGSAGAHMALATTISNTTPSSNTATLWAVVPQLNTPGALLGALYGYNVVADPTSSTFGSLGTAPIWHWNPVLGTGATCTNTPSGITSWFPGAFTEPTLADNQQNGTTLTGAVYVSALCSVNESYYLNIPGCDYAGAHGVPVQSGVLVFTSCH